MDKYFTLGSEIYNSDSFSKVAEAVSNEQADVMIELMNKSSTLEADLRDACEANAFAQTVIKASKSDVETIRNLREQLANAEAAANANARAMSEQAEKVKVLRDALLPFAYNDYSKVLSGNTEGEESIIFVRMNSELRIKHFLNASRVLEATK